MNILARLVAYSAPNGSGCRVWIRSKDTSGYGNIRVNGRLRKAHRVAYELVKGPIPDGLQLDHICRNRACIEVDHLRPVTVYENVHAPGSVATAAIHAAKTHCPHGHPYDKANTYMWRGGRYCRICVRERNRRYKARKRASRSAGLAPSQ